MLSNCFYVYLTDTLSWEAILSCFFVFFWFFFIVQLYTVYIIHERVSCCLSQRPTSRLWIFTGFYSIAIFRTVSKQFVSKNKYNNDKLSILIILKYPFVLKLYIMFMIKWLDSILSHIGKCLRHIGKISAIYRQVWLKWTI